MRIALYQPEIAGNVGAVLRIAACFGLPVDIVEPIGFVWSDARMRRAGMDYAARVDVTRHADWQGLQCPGRLMLMTTRGDTALTLAAFRSDDTLVFGSASTGVPAHVADACAARVRIAIAPAERSLNLSVAVGIAVHEALRQTGGLSQ